MSSRPRRSADETLPARFFSSARRRGAAVAHYYDADGRGSWSPMRWTSLAGLVRELAAGLVSLGHRPSEAVAIISQPRREWMYWDLAIMAVGGVSVGIYPTLDGSGCQALLRHSDAAFCVVEDIGQLSKVRACMSPSGPVRALIVLEPAHIDAPPQSGIFTHEAVRRRGRSIERPTIDVESRARALSQHDAAMFLYTSGATGAPKAAMISHGTLSAALDTFCRAGIHKTSGQSVTLLSPANPVQRMMDLSGVWLGMPGAYTTDVGAPLPRLARLRPTVLTARADQLERWYRAACEPANRLPATRWLLSWARDLRRQQAHERRTGRSSTRLQAQLVTAQRLLFQRLRRHLGNRLRRIVVTGASVAPEEVEFFDAAGINVIETWHMAETCGIGTLDGSHQRQLGSIGQPLDGIELALDPAGELLIRGPNVFSGYYKGGAATTMAFTADGYLRTGDIAQVDENGGYRFAGRRDERLETTGGAQVTPRLIERMLETDPTIEHALVVENKRPYLTALVAVSEAARAQLGENALARTVEGVIATKNADLPAGQQIRAVRVLPHALGLASGELTPTLAVKRAEVLRKFHYLVAEMYD
ncbi:AMP-dependent synthetase/ligase [Haliangium ochraceum]|uniref:AMP-dependent synthetase and ligase n=1 Tax=Haliangium ochraceum (strain DSM 14365 / JCM 11303 / SMP-2) TaxID=502025 RepID=D0LZK9_HALO1|nr:AMP-binding protein [Haliangium ochraceum]ACY17988.1 AMP-dependent synthetase and ligase [Haliangium ochraceum DSM 14365]